MDMSVLDVAELRNGEVAASLLALELRKVSGVIEEVLVGSVEMHQGLLEPSVHIGIQKAAP